MPTELVSTDQIIVIRTKEGLERTIGPKEPEMDITKSPVEIAGALSVLFEDYGDWVFHQKLDGLWRINAAITLATDLWAGRMTKAGFYGPLEVACDPLMDPLHEVIEKLIRTYSLHPDINEVLSLGQYVQVPKNGLTLNIMLSPPPVQVNMILTLQNMTTIMDGYLRLPHGAVFHGVDNN